MAHPHRINPDRGAKAPKKTFDDSKAGRARIKKQTAAKAARAAARKAKNRKKKLGKK